MAKIIRRRSRKKASKIRLQRNEPQGLLSRIRFVESYTSLILGAIVVLIIGIILLSFAKGSRNPQIGSVMDAPKEWEQISQGLQTSSTYTVNAGDDLWTISENVYRDGYRWVEIAQANKLENPGLIYVGSKLVIPTVAPAPKEEAGVLSGEQVSQAQNSVIQNNSITGDSYTVVSGDNLWDIAVRAYGDGFRWPEIAKTNNLVNPSLIHAGNFFKIPR